MTQESPKPKPKLLSCKEQPKQDNQEELSNSSWGHLVLFCNEFYQDFTPRNPNNRTIQEKKAKVHHQCLEKYLETRTANSWQDIAKQFLHNDYELAKDFFFELFYKYNLSPQEFMDSGEAKIKKFISYAQFAFSDSDNRDLLKIRESGEILDFFGKSPARIFFFLCFLSRLLDVDARKLIDSSSGYQELLRWGASQYLGRFCLRLQQHFRLTYTAQKDQAAQNLAEQLGETERNLKTQIELLQTENQELKNEVEKTKAEAFHLAVCQLAKTLQERPQPLLNQIYKLSQRLDVLIEKQEGLSSTETLTCFIVLGDIVNVLKNLDIQQYPKEEIFSISESELGEYNYVEGSSFFNSTEVKTVKCIRQGWRVNQTIITPAQVQERSEKND